MRRDREFTDEEIEVMEESAMDLIELIALEDQDD